MALCGDAAPADKIASETSQQYPVHTIWNAVYLPTINAATELKRSQPAKAVDLLQPARPYERGYPESIYVRGLAYLSLNEGPEAAAEFQKILDHKGAYWGIVYSASYVGLARAATISDDTAKAKKAYQDFFALWKDADPDVPLLIEARKEYAALH
jgi:tetratricopeptide (TPR) repeat protein